MKIGLALGSGAARGIAHIGVLKALREMGVTIDCISGASMGAMVAAAHAAGLPPGEMEEIASATTRSLVIRFFFPTPSRAGIVSGKKVEDFLKEKIGAKSFSQLKIPLAVETTDLETGEMVTFTSGPLIKALRASISIPLIFTPVEINGKILVDGGLVSPIPIQAVRNLGADYVIAVNVIPGPNSLRLSKPSLSKKALEKIRESTGNYNLLDRFFHLLNITPEDEQTIQKQSLGFIEVILKSYNIGRQKLVQYQLQAENPDLLIEPEIGNISGIDFHHGKEIVERAYQSSLTILRETLR